MTDFITTLPDVRLKFHIDHPTVEECYIAGYEAAETAYPEEANPFEANTDLHGHWADGWWDGYYNQPAIFSIKSIEEDEIALSEEPVAETMQAHPWMAHVIKITSVLGMTALVGYQLLDLVA